MSYLNQTVQVQPGQCTKEPTFVEELSGRLEKAIGQATAIRGRMCDIAERAHGAKYDESPGRFRFHPVRWEPCGRNWISLSACSTAR